MIISIVQARMGSTRFSGKSLKEVGNWTLIELVLKRVQQSTRINHIVLATSVNPIDDILDDHVSNLGFQVHRGSEDDVLSRFHDAANQYEPSIVVRITGDCPLISPTLIDHAIDSFIEDDVDYLSLSIGEEKELAYPRGLDVEIAKFESLTEAAEKATERYEREHVMPYLYTHLDRFSVRYLDPPPEFSRPFYRLCVDTNEDYEFILKIHSHFGVKMIDVDYRELISFLDDNPAIVSINQSVKQKHFKEID